MSSIGWSPSRNCAILSGQVVDRVEDEAVVLGRERAADLRELERDEDQQRHLRGERLRGGDADLEPAARVEDGVDLARDLRAHLVRDRDGRRAGRLREAHGRDRVARLAGLRDPDHQRVLGENRVAVDPLGRDVRLDRQARPLLDDVAADDARVVGGAARENDDAAQVLDLLVGEPQSLELELGAGPDAVADRLAHRIGLLVDLLEHEGLVPALLGLLVVPLDRLDLLVLDRPVGVEEARALGRDLDDLAVLDQLDPPRLVEERGRR